MDHSAGLRIVVWVDSWQFQCCGDDYSVGDTVSWRLKGSSGNWAAGVLGEHAPPPVGSLPVVGQLPAGELLGAGTVVGTGGLRVYLRGSGQTPPARDPDEQTARWVGQLTEDRHIGIPSDAPATRGMVRRIRLVRVAQHHDPARQAKVPTPGTATTEDVDPAPRWPDHFVDNRKFLGYLVDLDVTDH